MNAMTGRSLSLASARIRAAINADCTGDPPGELIESATALAPRTLNARSRAGLMAVSDKPMPRSDGLQPRAESTALVVQRQPREQMQRSARVLARLDQRPSRRASWRRPERKHDHRPCAPEQGGKHFVQAVRPMDQREM